MNWTKLKADFPNSYEEIKKAYEDKKTEMDDIFIRTFLMDKGYKPWATWIGDLRDYEVKQKNLKIDGHE